MEHQIQMSTIATPHKLNGVLNSSALCDYCDKQVVKECSVSLSRLDEINTTQELNATKSPGVNLKKLKRKTALCIKGDLRLGSTLLSELERGHLLATPPPSTQLEATEHQIQMSTIATPHKLNGVLNSSALCDNCDKHMVKECSVSLSRLDEIHTTQELNATKSPGVNLKKLKRKTALCVKDDLRLSSTLLSELEQGNGSLPQYVKYGRTTNFHHKLKKCLVLISKLKSADMKKISAKRTSASIGQYGVKECVVLVTKLKLFKRTEPNVTNRRPIVDFHGKLKECIVLLSKIELCKVPVPKFTEYSFAVSTYCELKKCAVVLPKPENWSATNPKPIEIVPYTEFIDNKNA